MIKIITCLFIGLLGHQLSPMFDILEQRLNGHGMAWTRIGRYAVGGLMIRLSTRVMLRGVRFGSNEPQNIDAVDNALAGGLVWIGAGVAAGYVLDIVAKDDS